MDQSAMNQLIKSMILNQRRVNYLFKLETGLNKAHLELLAYADTNISFNTYQAQQYFKQMNLQQLRVGIKWLIATKCLEQLNIGVKAKPAVYLINNKGRVILNNYYHLWYNDVMPLNR